MTDVHDGVQAIDEAPRGGRMPTWVAVAGALVVVLAVGIGIGWIVGASAAGPGAHNVLDRWEELPGADITGVASTVREGDTRFLGEVEGDRFYGTMGIAAEGPRQGEQVICLDVRREDESGVGSCASRQDFETRGVWVTGAGPGWRATYTWNAFSPPAKSTCPPEDWLRSCPAD